MLKRLMNFLMFSTGITPKDHKQLDKYAAIRAKREEWERMRRAQQDTDAGFHAAGGMGADDDAGHHGGDDGDGGAGGDGAGD